MALLKQMGHLHESVILGPVYMEVGDHRLVR